MNDENDDIVPVDSNADRALDIGAFMTAVLPIPWLAPAVSFVLSGISNQRKFDRIKDALGQLNEKLKDFKSEASETYVQSEEFQDLLEQTLSKVAAERNEEKRKIYGRFLAGAIETPGEPYDEQIRFLRDLDVLQPDHLRIFRAMLESPDPNSTADIGLHEFDTLMKRLPDIDEEKLRDLVAQLANLRMIWVVTNRKVSGSLALDLRNFFTPYGKRFLKYLTD